MEALRQVRWGLVGRFALWVALAGLFVAAVVWIAPRLSELQLGPVVLLVGGYFLPTIVARAQRNHQVVAIFVLNLLLGWTVVGWIVALVWAFIRPAPTSAQIAGE